MWLASKGVLDFPPLPHLDCDVGNVRRAGFEPVEQRHAPKLGDGFSEAVEVIPHLTGLVAT